MFSILPLWAKAAILAAIMAALYGAFAWFVHHQREIGRDEVRAEWALDREKQKDAAIKQAAANAIETQRRLTAQKEAQDANDKAMVRARADAASATAAASRLRSQLAAYTAAARSASGNPATVSDSTPAAAAIDLLADLYRRADERAGILSEGLDAARAAGLQCERAYDSLTVK